MIELSAIEIAQVSGARSRGFFGRAMGQGYSGYSGYRGYTYNQSWGGNWARYSAATQWSCLGAVAAGGLAGYGCLTGGAGGCAMGIGMFASSYGSCQAGISSDRGGGSSSVRAGPVCLDSF